MVTIFVSRLVTLAIVGPQRSATEEQTVVKSLAFQLAVQIPIIIGLWAWVWRDATQLRAKHGRPPRNIAPTTWGPLVGITWIALIPYLGARRVLFGGPTESSPSGEERHLPLLWLAIVAAGSVWTALDVAGEHRTNLIQHAILTAVAAAVGVRAVLLERRETAK